jgi:hypothetical protein
MSIHRGQIWKIAGRIYILGSAQSKGAKTVYINLTNLETGNTWGGISPARKLYNVTEQEWSDLLGGNARDVELLTNGILVLEKL